MSDASNHVVGDLDGLLALFGPVSGLAAVKAIPRLDAHCRRFIALSPFLVIGSTDRGGRADTSPKGDPPGFVRVLDDRTIAIPDRLSTDPDLLATMAVQGKAPALAIVIEIREAYLHCAKALKRSRLWDPESRVERGVLPSLGRMLLDQTRSGEEIASVEARIEQAYRDKLY